MNATANISDGLIGNNTGNGTCVITYNNYPVLDGLMIFMISFACLIATFIVYIFGMVRGMAIYEGRQAEFTKGLTTEEVEELYKGIQKKHSRGSYCGGLCYGRYMELWMCGILKDYGDEEAGPFC
jgi:hypothetical protein